jgi:hypothetical protein
MRTVIRTVNFIHVNARNHPQFAALFCETEGAGGEVISRTNMTWLSHEFFVHRFCNLVKEIKFSTDKTIKILENWMAKEG